MIGLNNNVKFLSKSLIAIDNILNLNDLNNTKMILGLTDNVRNLLLILLNQKIVSNGVEKKYYVELGKITQRFFDL